MTYRFPPIAILPCTSRTTRDDNLSRRAATSLRNGRAAFSARHAALTDAGIIRALHLPSSRPWAMTLPPDLMLGGAQNSDIAKVVACPVHDRGRDWPYGSALGFMLWSSPCRNVSGHPLAPRRDGSGDARGAGTHAGPRSRIATYRSCFAPIVVLIIFSFNTSTRRNFVWAASRPTGTRSCANQDCSTPCPITSSGVQSRASSPRPSSASRLLGLALARIRVPRPERLRVLVLLPMVTARYPSWASAC